MYIYPTDLSGGAAGRPEEAVVHMMHNGWGNVQYTVQSFDPAQREIIFERGGFQHGRGGRSGSFYVSSKPGLLSDRLPVPATCEARMPSDGL